MKNLTHKVCIQGYWDVKISEKLILYLREHYKSSKEKALIRHQEKVSQNPKTKQKIPIKTTNQTPK